MIISITYDNTKFSKDDMIEVRDFAEGEASKIFEIAQDHILMEVDAFNDLDEVDAPINMIVMGQCSGDEITDFEAVVKEHLTTYFTPQTTIDLWFLAQEERR